MKFFSHEWCNEVKEKANADPEFQKKAAKLNFKMHNLMTDCPGGTDRLVEWEFSKGSILSVKVEEKPAPSEFREIPWSSSICFTRATGSYDTYTDINKGKLAPMDGMARGLYKVDGEMAKLMPRMGSVAAFTDLMATIPCEY